MSDILQHFGVKGMKWGVRKTAGALKKKAVTRVKEEVSSAKRELSWGRDLKDIHKLNPKDLQKKVDRVRMENDLKALSKSQKVRNRNDVKQKAIDTKAYRNREKMTDNQLRNKVNELRLKDQLRKETSRSTAIYGTKGKEIVDSLASTKPGLKPYAEYGKSIVDYALGAYQ